jgi:RHS repeat-associated protein
MGTATTNYTNASSPILYAPYGAIQQMTLGNQLVEQTCHNPRLQAVGIRLGSAATSACANSGSDPLNLTLGYGSTNNNGNLLSQTIVRHGVAEGTWAQSYTATDGTPWYDGVNRLTAASEGAAWSQTYQYDGYGNRAVLSGVVNGYATPTAPTQYTNNRWYGNGAGYDAAGNQTALPARTYTYDAEDRLVATVGPNIGAVTYGYDGDGRRVTKLICPSGNPSCTAAAAGAQFTVYAYDAGGQLAAEYGAPSDTGTEYPTADQLGSTRVVADGGGNVKKCYDYYPFGEDIARGGCFASGVYPESAPDAVSQRFTGKERDWETGLDYFGARYFSGAQGRFTSPDGPFNDQDTSDPQSWNLYGYGRNNPLAFIDPDGTTTCDANGDNCHDEVTVNGGTTDPIDYVWSFLRSAGSQTMQTTTSILDTTWQFIRNSNNWQYPSCVAGKMGAWGAAGAAAGAAGLSCSRLLQPKLQHLSQFRLAPL